MSRRSQPWQMPLPGGPPRSVLIVEDIAPVRRSISILLGAAGFRIFEAEDGAEALDVLSAASALAREPERSQGGAIDLVLTDVMMPFGGVALVQEIRARWPEQRVLYMSGFPAALLHREGVRTADAPFLAKPFSPDELMSKVWEALQSRSVSAGRAAPPSPASPGDSAATPPGDAEDSGAT